jgi:hypothetical protein
MTDIDRDTHFAGFAKLLYSEIEQARHDLNRDIETLIAQHAYDLAAHAVASISEATATEREVEILTVEQCVNIYVPDLTEWPEH